MGSLAVELPVQVGHWDHVTEKLCDVAGKALMEASAMARAVAAARNGLDMETFVKATVLLHKVGTSKDIKAFGDQIRASCNLSAVFPCSL